MSNDELDLCNDCELCNVEDAPAPTSTFRFAQYDIEISGGSVSKGLKSHAELWWRVVCRNELPSPAVGGTADNLLGPTGHLERMNVWSHMAGAGAYAAYLGLRERVTPMGDIRSLSNTLAYVSGASLVVTFVSSSVYHVYSADAEWGAYTRLGDYAGIYLSICTGTTTDVAIASVNLTDASWQAVADVWIGMVVLVAFFTLKRFVVPIETTRRPYFLNKCSLGLARNTHVDLEHSALRAAAGIAMAFSWACALPAAFDAIELDCAWAIAAARIVATLTLILGMFVDNVLLYPDRWINNEDAKKPMCLCHNPHDVFCGGWVMTSHALWHWVALASVVIYTAGTEYAIATSETLAM